ncbi:MAG: membrane fusion protein, multidrug efflux system, partial [Verrucomicrobia bacterium]
MNQPDLSNPASSNRVSRSGKVGCFVLILALLGSGGWWWWSEVSARQRTAAALEKAGAGATRAPGRRGLMTSVTVAPVRQEDIEEWLTIPGTVTPLQEVTVRSRIDGELRKVHFVEGGAVKAGALLAEIDPRPFEVAMDRARAAQARNEALLANARAD